MTDSAVGGSRRTPRGVVAVSVLLSLIGLAGAALLASTLLERPPPRQVLDALGQALIFRSLADLDPWVTAVVGGVGAVVFLPLAVGFWRRRRWAWVGTMIAASVTITAHVLARLFGDLGGQWSWGEASLAVTIGVVFYLNQHDVQLDFKAPDRPLPEAPLVRGVGP